MCLSVCVCVFVCVDMFVCMCVCVCMFVWCFQMSKMEEAIEDCTSAIRLDPNYIRAYERRAKL